MLIHVVGDAAPSVPDWFRTRLAHYDPTLLLAWNGRKRKWVIEQCVRHHAPAAAHSHVCERIYVWMVQDAQGDPMPLGEHVLEKLAAIDLQRQGFGPEDREKFIRRLNQEQLELERKREAEIASMMRHNRLYHRVQLNRAFSLIQRHDLRVNR